MKKFLIDYKGKIILFVLIILLATIGYFTYTYLKNENTLTVEERNWVEENKVTALNINVVNDVNIFGDVGVGVYYDFINDFSNNYNLDINPITFKYGDTPQGLSLNVGYQIKETDLVIYSDYYVLVSKEDEIISSYTEIESKDVGILKSSSALVKTYLTGNTKSFDTKEDILSAFNEELDYMLVPKYIFVDTILDNNYNIIYHLNDIKYYYYISLDDTIFSDVIKKYYNRTWKYSVYDSFKKNEFDLFTENLKITDSEIASLSSIDFNYGFVTNSPYEVISSGKFGGISSVFLKEFSDFANIDFEYIKFDNFKDLVESVNSKELDLYLDKYNFTNDYTKSNSGIEPDYVVVVNRTDDLVVDSLNGLMGQTIYVEANTKIYDYINKYKNIDIKTYSSEKELFALNKENAIIIIDKLSFDYYSKYGLNMYTSRLTFDANTSYNFATKNNDALYKLINSYINVTDLGRVINDGVDNHAQTISVGNMIETLFKYIVLSILLVVIIMTVFIKRTKKIKIAKKIKKEDKLKYIDQLTSLKNRNYFNDQKDVWDKTEVYPQTIVIVDLNSIQKINDKFGYEAGDKQICSFANALIKTQPDSSEIMRTDGNEFVIYLLGYSQKQVVNYIHKLNKELKKLPYEDGAKFGYKMKIDDLLTVEDALCEAQNDMLKNKKEVKNEK